MPRFVILYHELPQGSARPSHWDLMLEQDGRLRTWALDQPLLVNVEVRAVALADHRLAYLEYEGPVSGDRGRVSRIDQGEYDSLDESVDSIRVRLHGQQIRGELSLQRVSKSGEQVATIQSWVARLLPESDA